MRSNNLHIGRFTKLYRFISHPSAGMHRTLRTRAHIQAKQKATLPTKRQTASHVYPSPHALSLHYYSKSKQSATQPAESLLFKGLATPLLRTKKL